MSGIAGRVDYTLDLGNEKIIMNGLCKVLAPRGGDGDGVFVSDCGCCVLGSSRMAVLDLVGGVQPMIKKAKFSEKKYTVVYNGELYNTEEIRTELKNFGYDFAGYSDTEVLLTAYIQWGEECVKRLNGIFAFTIWDGEKLFMARDAVGVKPFFFYKYESGIIFASEIKALLAHPNVPKILNRQSIAELVLLGPARNPGSGVYKDICELKPGECATFTKNDGFKKRTFWKLTARRHYMTLDDSIYEAKRLITDSIKRQLVGDVPLCCFLSGGLDSSVISAIVAEEFRKNGKKLSTYSLDYEDNSRYFKQSEFQPNEDAPYITTTAKHIRSNHTNIIFSEKECADNLLPAGIARDFPGMADIDSSLLIFCREVRKKFKIALSGECADELFGGYPWFSKIANAETSEIRGFPWSQSTKERASLLRPEILLGIDSERFISDIAQKTLQSTEFVSDHLGEDSPKEKLMRQMFALNYYHFMQTLIDRKDRMSAAAGLEARVPFCDIRIVDFAFNLPWEMKNLYGREKGIIRQAMEKLLPSDIIWRKKSPFPKTHNPAYLSRVIGDFKNILSRENRITEIFEAGKLIQLVESSGKSFEKNWYGQLMAAPQLFAFLIQFEQFLINSNATISL